MTYKLLLWIFAAVILCSAAHAALTDGLVTYHSFETYTGELGLYNWTNVGSTNGTGRIGQGLTFDGDDYLTLDGGNDLLAASGAINIWLNITDYSSTRWILGRWDNPPNEFAFYVDSGAGGEIVAMNTALQSNSAIDNATWVMVTIMWSGSNSSIHYNSIHNNTAAVGLTPASATTILGANNDAGPGTFWLGQMDELGVWNRTLTQTEIDSLYNGGAGYAYPFSTETEVDLTAVDDFNGSSITNFSVNITWSNNGSTTTHTTTNGTVALTNVTENDITVNVTYFNATDYYNLTLFNQAVTANISNTIQANIYQAELNMHAREKVSNATVTGATFYTGSKSGTVFNVTAATHTVTFTHEGYYNSSDDFTISALTNTTQTITGVYGGVANTTVYYSNGTVLNNWGINITSAAYTNWSGERIETTNGSVYFNGINGTYTATINSTEGNESFTFTINSTSQNVTYYYFDLDNCTAYTDVFLNFTILNEDDDTLLNDSTLNLWFNVTSDFYSGYREHNLSYSSGNYYTVCVANNSVPNWTVNAQAEYSNLPTYTEKNYYLVDYVLNSTTENINLYLTNGTSQVTLQVRDYNDDAISDAYVRVLSYDLGTDSYRTTEILNTDTGGDAYAQMVLNTVWYAFIIEYGGEIVLQTLPTKITSTTRTFRVDLETDYFANYDVVQGITHSLTYTNATTTFSFTWSDPTGTTQQGCLRLRRRTINGETQLNSSCQTSTAATILMSIPESVGTSSYIADSYVIFDGGQEFALNSTTVSFNTTYRTFGASGIFFSFLIILALVMVGVWHPVVAVVLMVVGVVATNAMDLFYLNWAYIVTFVILAGITIYRVGKTD